MDNTLFSKIRFLAHLGTTCSRGAFRVVLCLLSVVGNFFNPLPDEKILDRFKLKQSADANLKFHKNSRKVIQMGKKHCGKRRNCSLRAISPFPTVFSKGLFSRGVKRRHCVGMG